MIKTDEEYQQKLLRLEEIFDSKPNTPEFDELKQLGNEIEQYEDEHYPIQEPIKHSIDCAHPREDREYIGANMLRCKRCGYEFK